MDISQRWARLRVGWNHERGATARPGNQKPNNGRSASGKATSPIAIPSNKTSILNAFRTCRSHEEERYGLQHPPSAYTKVPTHHLPTTRILYTPIPLHPSTLPIPSIPSFHQPEDYSKNEQHIAPSQRQRIPPELRSPAKTKRKTSPLLFRVECLCRRTRGGRWV